MNHDLFFNKVKAAAAAATAQLGQSRWGTVTSARQTDTGYQAKVTLQPEGVQTGWLPVLSPFVGSGWGLVCPPVLGMQAFVVPDTGDHNHPVIVGLTYSTQAMPPLPGKVAVKSGQFALVHKNGSFLHFNDDDVLLTTNRDLVAKVGRDVNVTTAQDVSVQSSRDVTIGAARNTTIQAADKIAFSAPQIGGDADGKGGNATWNFQGSLFVSGDVSDGKGALDRLRQHYDSHTHTDSHGDTTGTPTPQD